MGISRRSFLAAGLATGLGAGALAACTPGSGPAPTTTVPAPTTAPPPTTTATPIDYQALAGRLGGASHLLTPGQPGYDLAARAYNPLFDGQRPGGVALCSSADDVAACVRAAAASRTPVAARSGGHSYGGYSNPTGALVVDLSGMADVTVNQDGTAVVGAGARLIDVYTALAGAGRALPAGSCPSVGVAGMTLGGGIGVLSRQFGLTCDHLTSATVVTADGRTRTASATVEPDLFWALRGGGGGNFGIVTSFTFSTVPAPSLTVFSLGYPAGTVGQVFPAWQDWLDAAPDALWTNCNITGGNPSSCTIAGCLVGSTATASSLISDLTGRIGRAPGSRSVRAMAYLDAMRSFAGCASESAAQCQAQTRGAMWKREAFVASSRMMQSKVSDASAVAAACDGHPDLHLIIDGLGGAVSRVGPADTAFPHRGAFASCQIYLKTTAAGAGSARAAVTAVRDALSGPVGSGSYVNYLDPTLPDWATAYYGANLPRLRTVAHMYDPDGVFRFAQSLTPA